MYICTHCAYARIVSTHVCTPQHTLSLSPLSSLSHSPPLFSLPLPSLSGFFRLVCELTCSWCCSDRSERQQRTPRRRELERKQQLDVERWLKEKFREGFFNMRKEFEDRDTEKKGIVSSAFSESHFNTTVFTTKISSERRSFF